MSKVFFTIVLSSFILLPTFAMEQHQSVSRSIEINASADQVWQLLRKLDGVEAFSGGMVTHSKIKGEPGVGCERICTMNDGAKIKEIVRSFSDAERSYSYQVYSDMMPVSKMINSAQVLDLGYQKSLLVWKSNFIPAKGADPAQISQMMGGMLEMVLGQVKNLKENQS
jgi:hypothetical protein